ncbi:MAG: tryptophan synthase subunit beta [Bdellovibrionota bacterium]
MATKRAKKDPYSVDSKGHYGPYGGRYAPEVLMPALLELEECFNDARKDKKFLRELKELQQTYIGRPTPLYFCGNLTKKLGGARIYVKNEGLAHTGAHKINHCVGQALLAQRMGKKRIIAETGAGQHGLATSAVSARFGFECEVYMGARDVARQRPNVFWMEQFGARVHPVKFGGQRLKDAVNAALKDWITNVKTSHYLLGSCLGPHPFPEMNRFFQAVVGQEIKEQIKAQTGALPNYVIACVGGGSNALGAFDAFLKDKSVALIGVEAGGKGIRSGKHAVRFHGGKTGIVEGYKSYWLLGDDGQVADTHSISAGLDYAGIGPLHAQLRDLKRVQYSSATDDEALKAFQLLASHEGILPALESSHALAHAVRIAPTLSKKKSIVVNLSGRAEKDIFILARHLADEQFHDFLRSYLKEK